MDRGRDRDRDGRGAPRGGGGDRDHRRRDRSPPRRRRRSRSRDRRSSSGAPKPDDQQKLREMLLMEAAKKNPDAASVLQNATADQEALQRALATATNLSASQHQQGLLVQHQQRQQQHQQQQHNQRSNQGRIPDNEKIFLELHIGNLPDQVTDEVEFTRFLNEVALQKHVNIDPGNPVISCRINHAGHFAFALFRTRDEATRGMELTGTTCYGNTLRVDRPRGYKELMGTQRASAPNTATAAPSIDENQMIAAIYAANPLPNFPGLSKEELRQRLEASVAKYGDPTSLVQLANLEGASVNEVDAEARKYGNVTGVKPSPDKQGVFLVKMASIADAEKLVQLKRAFQRNKVIATFRPLVEWTALQESH